MKALLCWPLPGGKVVMLTERQMKLVEFIVGYLDRTDVMPTFREMAEAIGSASSNAATSHVTALLRKGVLERVNVPEESARGASKARCFRVVGQTRADLKSMYDRLLAHTQELELVVKRFREQEGTCSE